MFGFTLFWPYVNFSQYFLYWYGNMQEETKWFLDRRVGRGTRCRYSCRFLFRGTIDHTAPESEQAKPEDHRFHGGLCSSARCASFYWEIMPESLKENVADLPSRE